MATDLEARRVLRIVEVGGNVEALLEFKIPYARTLELLRAMLANGLIVEGADAKLVLTDVGREILATPLEEEPTRRPPDILDAVKRQPADPDDVHVPSDELP